MPPRCVMRLRSVIMTSYGLMKACIWSNLSCCLNLESCAVKASLASVLGRTSRLPWRIGWYWLRALLTE